MASRARLAESFLDWHHPSSRGKHSMNLTRHTITAGVVALGLGLSASPAMAKGGGDGGGDINNSVVTFISPSAPAPFIGSSGGGSGSGGTNRPATCRATGVDPITGSIIMVCTQARA